MKNFLETTLKKIADQSKNPKDIEKNIELLLEKLSTNPALLNTLSLILNTHSIGKLLFQNTLEKLWKNLQLPNKKDQERTIYLIHELQFKIFQLEKDLKAQRVKNSSQPIVTDDSTPSNTNQSNSKNNSEKILTDEIQSKSERISVLKTKKQTVNSSFPN